MVQESLPERKSCNSCEQGCEEEQKLLQVVEEIPL